MTLNFTDGDVNLNGFSVNHEAPFNFLLKLVRTGLNITVGAGTQRDLLGLLSLEPSIDNTIITANISTAAFSLNSGVLKFPYPVSLGYTNSYCDYNIDVRFTGTISGNVQTAREFALELQRANGELLERKAVIKINDTTLGSRGIHFETYTLGESDPFIISGAKLILNNSSNQTITLTGFTFILKGKTY